MTLARNLVFALSLAWMGCAGTQPQAQTTPVAPEAPAATEAAAAATDATAAPAADGAAAQPAASDPSATALGPQITAQGVRFNFKPTGKVGKIYLAGSFNGWNPTNDDFLLKDDDGDGIFSLVLQLAPGTYQYKYVIDGAWTKDSNAPMDHPDGFGGYNGKFKVP